MSLETQHQYKGKCLAVPGELSDWLEGGVKTDECLDWSRCSSGSHLHRILLLIININEN